MASIKIHAVLGTDRGTVSCDYRGDRFIGHDEGDEHRTLGEIDPATEADVELALEAGPSLNVLLSRLVPAKGVGELLGKEAFLRIGVWDD